VDWAKLWDFLKLELAELFVRHPEARERFGEYLKTAIEVMMSEYQGVQYPEGVTLDNAVAKVVEGLMKSKDFERQVITSFKERPEQEKFKRDKAIQILLIATKALLKDYRVIRDESV
jgi:hypothetical protein